MMNIIFNIKTLCFAKQNISFKKGDFNLKRGFTLIELLVVISIMSILTVITASQFTTARKRARDVARKGDLNSLSKALMSYYADYGKFPPAVGVGISGAAWGGEFKDSSNFVYMKVVPRENFESSSIPPYCYVVSADQKKFGLFAMLEVTTDADCKMKASPVEGLYSHCTGKKYCYAVVSPNIIVNDLGSINP